MLCNLKLSSAVPPASRFSSFRGAVSTMAAAMGKGSVVAIGLCLLVVMASLAIETEAATCNLYSLMPCLSAVEGARPRAPSASCCKVVKTVDKNCLCAQLKSGSYPKQMVENALLLPKKCGRTNLAGFRCGGKWNFCSCAWIQQITAVTRMHHHLAWKCLEINCIRVLNFSIFSASCRRWPMELASLKQFTAVFDLRSCFCVQRTPFRTEQNPNASQNKITAQEQQWNNGPAARKQASKPKKKKNLASSDCCKRCSHKRFTSSDSILAAKSCTMLVLPGMSFCRRSRRSWSNKLRRLLSPHETVHPWQAAGTRVLHASLVECHVWMLGCLHMFAVLHEQLCWIICVLLQGTSVQYYENSLDLYARKRTMYRSTTA